MIIDGPYISKIMTGEKIWEVRRKPTNKTDKIALGARGTSKAVGTAKIERCFQMPVETLVQHTKETCSTPESIREYAKGKKNQKSLSSLWVYVLKDVKAIEPVPYSYSGGSWCFAEIEK